MRRINLGSGTLFSLVVSISAGAHAERVPPDLLVANPRVYEVTITTKFVVPKNGKTLNELRVWHALPNSRPWDGLDRALGASEISSQPETGQVKYLAHNESQHVFWGIRDGLKPGKTFELVSRFRVRSADRTYDYKRSIARWSDYQYAGVQDSRQPVEGELARLVDGIRKSHPPAEAALEFCEWVAENIKYDASVPYDVRDLAAIVNNRKGHCGHQMTMFDAMCARAGIPTRVILGLNLNTPGGIGELHRIRADFENQHTWMQVYLPGSGWIEIDPGMGAKAYFFPAQVIQNNTDFQNYVIWIVEDGTSKTPDWEYRSGRWYSPYGIENRRTFRVIESK
jgi:Transglutaminase-like superfamily